MNTADFVKSTMLVFCSCATPWFRKASVSARSVAVLLLRCCKNSDDRVNVRAYRFAFASRVANCRCSWCSMHRLLDSTPPTAWSPSATSSKLTKIARSGMNRFSNDLTLPSVSWFTRSGLSMNAAVVVVAWQWSTSQMSSRATGHVLRLAAVDSHTRRYTPSSA